MPSVNEVLNSMGERHDQLVVAAALAKSPDLQQAQVAWKRICEKINGLEEQNKRRTNILRLVQEALGQLRLDMKYLMFDLEATRRERDSLREKYNDHDDHASGGD